MVGRQVEAVGSRFCDPTACVSRLEISLTFWHTETPIMPIGATVIPIPDSS